MLIKQYKRSKNNIYIATFLHEFVSLKVKDFKSFYFQSIDIEIKGCKSFFFSKWHVYQS